VYRLQNNHLIGAIMPTMMWWEETYIHKLKSNTMNILRINN
jgi:hypothetical protein